MDSDKYSILKDCFIDLTQVLNDVPNVYIGFCHVSPDGNEIIANSLIDEIDW